MAEPSYTCPVCGMVSYNPNDIAHRYCGNCHLYEGDFEQEERLRKWMESVWPPWQCEGCKRHISPKESVCPFCGGARAKEVS